MLTLPRARVPICTRAAGQSVVLPASGQARDLVHLVSLAGSGCELSARPVTGVDVAGRCWTLELDTSPNARENRPEPDAPTNGSQRSTRVLSKRIPREQDGDIGRVRRISMHVMRTDWLRNADNLLTPSFRVRKLALRVTRLGFPYVVVVGGGGLLSDGIEAGSINDVGGVASWHGMADIGYWRPNVICVEEQEQE
ncbi:hypothetical protein EG329_009154 [Mollisiaceae sp. DMI_Dod_QoI]|nr:hypothetical protein EG329_009154 [Helotiales sp. DMI_Dod_QoI]